MVYRRIQPLTVNTAPNLATAIRACVMRARMRLASRRPVAVTRYCYCWYQYLP